jgi:hypothetical protein
MIRPVPSVGTYGSAAWVTVNAPSTCTSNSSRIESWVVLPNIAGLVTPALLTTMCSAPSARPAACWVAAAAESGSETSSAAAWAVPPAFAMRSATAAAASLSRSVTSTAAPASASAVATAEPMPPAAPVTSAARPVRSK